MKFINTRNPDEKVSFKQATLNGLASGKGLYVPENIPQLPADFFENISKLDDQEIAFTAMHPYVQGSMTDEELRQVLKETLAFSIPVKQLSKNTHVLELFHGPTMAFKDLGARFMANCLGLFNEGTRDITVLVATSGDTGSAVAHGFYKVKGVEVLILFPKGKVSAFQEYQMTSLGANIRAIAVDGTFDDCQALVKQALQDETLKQQIQLSSANSINVARFLPQMLFYFFAYKQLQPHLQQKKLMVSVPSGNFGNLTSGLYAKKMGLPIHKFIAANNANDTFYQYCKSGKYEEKPSVATFSNAMDVGAPSNFERILHLYQHNLDYLKQDIQVATFSDQETLQEIKSTYEKLGYILDPHAAVGSLALRQHLDSQHTGVFLATAAPQKFEQVVKMAVPDYQVQKTDLSNCTRIEMENSYASLLEIIMKK